MKRLRSMTAFLQPVDILDIIPVPTANANIAIFNHCLLLQIKGLGVSQNKVQCQKGISLPEFMNLYGTEEQCFNALFQWRWPDGFICPKCGGEKSCQLRTRKLQQCNTCHHQTSLSAGTIFESTKLPLTRWFLGLYFITQDKKGISALALMRRLGISYKAAWRMKQKLMRHDGTRTK